MIVALIVAVWLLLLVILSGLCRAARAGDETMLAGARTERAPAPVSPYGVRARSDAGRTLGAFGS